jgi:heme-degrading monooxygenase HmoA
MAYVLVHHKVEDYNKWKAAYDEHSDFRTQYGSKGGKVFQSADNPDELFVLLEWNNLDNARNFAKSDDLKKAMQEAGVVGMPDIFFIEEAAESAT